MFGRCFKVGLRRGDPDTAVYFVAESAAEFSEVKRPATCRSNSGPNSSWSSTSPILEVVMPAPADALPLAVEHAGDCLCAVCKPAAPRIPLPIGGPYFFLAGIGKYQRPLM